MRPRHILAPRLTDLNVVPQTDALGQPFFPATPTGGFPFTYPPAGTGLAIQWGLDNRIKTPYAYTFDLSIGRELPKNMISRCPTSDAWARRLLSQGIRLCPEHRGSGFRHQLLRGGSAAVEARVCRHSDILGECRLGGTHCSLLAEHGGASDSWRSIFARMYRRIHR